MKAISILYQNSFKLWRAILRQEADAEAERNEIRIIGLQFYFLSRPSACVN